MPDLPPARLPKYRHYKPKDLAVVRLNGRDHYLGRYGSAESREKYRRLVAEWMAAGHTPPAPGSAGPGPAVSELILAYLQFAAGYYVKGGRPTGEVGNVKGAVRPLRQLYGLTPAREFGLLALKAVRRAMVDAGLCRNEVNPGPASSSGCSSGRSSTSWSPRGPSGAEGRRGPAQGPHAGA